MTTAKIIVNGKLVAIERREDAWIRTDTGEKFFKGGLEPLTSSIIKNGKPVLIMQVDGNWCNTETGETITDLELIQMQIGNIIDATGVSKRILCCDAPDNCRRADVGRKLSCVEKKLEEAMFWLRSVDLHEHHAVPYNE